LTFVRGGGFDTGSKVPGFFLLVDVILRSKYNAIVGVPSCKDPDAPLEHSRFDETKCHSNTQLSREQASVMSPKALKSSKQ